MKKIVFIFLFLLLFSFPCHVHAGGAAAAAVAESIFLQDMLYYFSDIATQASEVYNMVESVLTLKEQLENIIESEKRAIKNLTSILDVRSFGDFMNWMNRTAYLSREAEARYASFGVSVGKNRVGLKDIDKIPDALRTTFHDPFSQNFSEEEKYQMLTQMGLSPSNYMYLKTWQVEGDDIARRVMTYAGIFSEEADEAALRNREMLGRYNTSSEDLDINKLTKEGNTVLMNQEMAIREQTGVILMLHRWLLARDREENVPPSPPVLSPDYGQPMFTKITGGAGTSTPSY